MSTVILRVNSADVFDRAGRRESLSLHSLTEHVGAVRLYRQRHMTLLSVSPHTDPSVHLSCPTLYTCIYTASVLYDVREPGVRLFRGVFCHGYIKQKSTFKYLCANTTILFHTNDAVTPKEAKSVIRKPIHHIWTLHG